ncbi:MAG: hypothetical protein AB7Q16_09330 [Vicinamibacterales bacterium]
MTPRAALRVIVALAAVVVGIGALSLVRPGYTPDEEYTLFAVRGISAHGVPLLPSGLLYDRGLAYSYLSWLAATLSGVELPAFRALSLLSGAAVLVVGYTLIRTSVSAAAGVASALLVAASVPFWAAITTGRFYAPFLLTCVAILAVVSRLRCAHLPAPVRTRPHPPAPARTRSLPSAPVRTRSHPPAPARTCQHPFAPARTWLALAGLAFLSRLTHELAFTLMAIPVAGLLLDCRRHVSERPADLRHLRHLRLPGLRHLRLPGLRHLRLWSIIAASIGIGVLGAQSALTALHYAVPSGDAGGGVMVRRFFVWQVLNLFERPQGGPLGVILAGLVVAWLLAPGRAVSCLKVAASAAAATVAIGVVLASASAPVSAALVRGVIQGNLTYPLDMFWHLAGEDPVMACAALVLLVARMAGAGGDWHASERAAHLGWVSWVLWFGVIESGITINYVLLPAVCMLAAIGIDLVAIAEHTRGLWPGRRAQLIRGALQGAAALIVVSHWREPGLVTERLSAARPTIQVAGIEEFRSTLQPEDVVACTDELACLLLVGRVDAWLALDDFVRERFVVERGAGPVGVYAGAPAAFTIDALFARARPQDKASRVIVIDVFKEYPVGNSATWLPRSLDAGGYEGETLVSTPQARVVALRAE